MNGPAKFPTTDAKRPRGGFTLLEIILALALTSFVLVAITMAMDFHLRVVDRGRVHVEEAQLARALLQLIADDLRSAVGENPIDYDELLADAISSADLDEENFGETGDFDPPPVEPLVTGDPATSVQTFSVPGVYGESNWLQVDVSRLPKPNQYQWGLSRSTDSISVDLLSDVKTVAYYMLDPYQTYSTTTADGTVYSGGLVRRELDRAVTNWASEQGRLADFDCALEPISPEVAAIEFQYFDGIEWVDTWNSEERGGLPLAVQIVLAFIPEGSTDSDPYSTNTTGYEELLAEDSYTVYRLVVHLPAAQPASETDMDLDMALGGTF